MSDELVAVTVVSSAGEAEILCGLLRVEGIPAMHRATSISASRPGRALIDWREILVRSPDLERARELIEPVDGQ